MIKGSFPWETSLFKRGWSGIRGIIKNDEGVLMFAFKLQRGLGDSNKAKS